MRHVGVMYCHCCPVDKIQRLLFCLLPRAQIPFFAYSLSVCLTICSYCNLSVFLFPKQRQWAPRDVCPFCFVFWKRLPPAGCHRFTTHISPKCRLPAATCIKPNLLPWPLLLVSNMQKAGSLCFQCMEYLYGFMWRLCLQTSFNLMSLNSSLRPAL